MSTEPPTERLGLEGEGCDACGAPLATDQRYCLNCGTARAEPRLDFKKHLAPALAGSVGTPAPAGAAVATGGPAGAGAPVGMQQVNPITAIFAIALLGVMLLLGVLIGKDDNPTTVAAAPATTTAPVATTPTDTTAAAPDKGKDKGKGGSAPGQGNVVAGGSGDTTGVTAADTSASTQEALRGPDVVATQGDKAPLDPDGPVGGGSDAVCIGC